MVVDSPGYGFTAAPVKLKTLWWKMIQKYLCYGVRLNLILLCIPAHRGIQGQDIKVLEELKYFNKPVHIVLTKVDQVKNNEQLVRTLNETSGITHKYGHFVNPEIHLVCSEHNFGIPDLRSRIGLAFELDHYIENFK